MSFLDVRWRSITALVVGLVLVLALGVGSNAEAAVKQPSCGKQKAKIRKSKGSAKRAAKLAFKQCKANLLVYGQIKDSRITGVRADGVATDDLYCASGKWQSDVGSGGPVYKTGWYVTAAKVKNAKKFTAVVVGALAGGRHEISVARNGAKWQVGWVSFDEPRDLGDATRTAARSECGKL